MCAISLLLALSMSTEQPITKYAPPENEQQQTATYTTNKTFDTASANTPIQQQTSSDQTGQNQPASSDRIYKVEVTPQPPDPWFKWYVIFTGAIAGLNVGMLFLMWLQRRAMLGQIDEMQKARQHDRDMSKLEYRAWLQFKELEGGFSEIGALNVRLHFTNTGRTPAKDVHMWYVQEKVPAGKRPSFYYGEEHVISSHIIPPHGETTLSHGINAFGVTDEQWIKIMRRELFVFLHGKMTYKDVFGDPHWLTFCFFYIPNSATFRVSDYHNETDD